MKREAGLMSATTKVAASAAIIAGALYLGTFNSSAEKARRKAAAAVAAAATPRPAAQKLLSAPPAIDEPESEPALVVKRVMNVSGPLKHGFYAWDDADVPPGPITVTVDLAAQTMSVFRGGYEIGVAVILYGAEDKPTPLGIYPITEKKVHHYSNLYDAEMPYMQRLTNDGVAIHASQVSWGAATHGCIGLPRAFAKKLFETTKVGDRVIITSGEKLFVGKSLPAT